MSITDRTTAEGPFEGSRVLAGPDGFWRPGTIRRVLEDGTFKIEFDDKDLIVFPYWYGVPPAEVSFDDALRWPAVLEQFHPGRDRFGSTHFHAVMQRLGYEVTAEWSEQGWLQGCQQAFSIGEAEARQFRLDREQIYPLLRKLGLSAKACADRLVQPKPPEFRTFYWNQTRMGGRSPTEVIRPVTNDDALAALGLSRAQPDRSSLAFFDSLEKEWGVRLPAALTDLLGRRGAATAVSRCHPNNPNLLPFRRDDWQLHRNLRTRGLAGDLGLVILEPHQGEHRWAAVFDDGADDAAIYLYFDAPDGDVWVKTAPTAAMFFWDLAQTGLAWYIDTKFKGRPRCHRTDIGLAVTERRWW